MLNAITGGRRKESAVATLEENNDVEGLDQEPHYPKKAVSVRCGNSVLWLDPDLDLLPQKEEIKRRHHELVRSGHDKQVRPRKQSKKYDYTLNPL